MVRRYFVWPWRSREKTKFGTYDRTMEDVQFLRKQAKEESYLFVVDSAKRDKSAYPSPSEYTFQFNAPFKNVIGMEMLDASIPRSEYIVDSWCNTLVYTVNNGPKQTMTVPEGDYNLLQLCEKMSTLLNGIGAEPVSAPYAQTSRLRFFGPQPFVLYLGESTMRRQLGFAGTEKTVSSALAADATTTRAFRGPFPGFETVRVEPGNAIRQAFVPTESGTAFSVVVYIDQTTSSEMTVSIVDGAGTQYGTATVTPAAQSESRVVNASSPLVAGDDYFLVLESDGGADVYTNIPAGDMTYADRAPSASGPWTQTEYAVACDVFTGVDRFELESTHLADLTGVRYVMVRCPEIETYLYRERAYEPLYAGLGMVKLGGNGIREQRFDFVSFPARTLVTPLGKLSSISIRLEKPDGTVYNSRGIDHSLVFVIRYYSGIKADSTPDQQRILNPMYSPHTLEYLEKTRWREEVDARDTMDAWARNSVGTTRPR